MKKSYDMSLMKVNDEIIKTYKGYYSDETIEKKIKKENVLAKQVCSDINVKSFIDISKFIALIIPKIENSQDKIIIEKYLQGYTLKEISKIVGISFQLVNYRIKKYTPLLQETYYDECAIKDLFNSSNDTALPSTHKIPVEKSVALARMVLENEYDFKTYIYPFDIHAYSYIITLKHPVLGTKKITQKGIIDLVNKLKKKL